MFAIFASRYYIGKHPMDRLFQWLVAKVLSSTGDRRDLRSKWPISIEPSLELQRVKLPRHECVWMHRLEAFIYDVRRNVTTKTIAFI